VKRSFAYADDSGSVGRQTRGPAGLPPAAASQRQATLEVQLYCGSAALRTAASDRTHRQPALPPASLRLDRRRHFVSESDVLPDGFNLLLCVTVEVIRQRTSSFRVEVNRHLGCRIDA